MKNLIQQPRNEFINNTTLQLQGERILEIISQIMLDICTHIISKSEIDAPTSYIDCMTKLVQFEIIPEKEKKNYIELVKMRNLIVHQYDTINYTILFDSLKQILVDFKSFERYILDWLNKRKNNDIIKGY